MSLTAEIAHREILQVRDELRDELVQMRGVMNRVVETLDRLARLEERNAVVTLTISKLEERVARAESVQHQQEIQAAANGPLQGRVHILETEFKRLHIERENEKSALQARVQTAGWIAKTGWAVLGVLGSGFIYFVTNVLPLAIQQAAK